MRLTEEHVMQEIVSTITSKGQVTIPAAVRRHLGVGTNDKITFVLEENGAVRLRVPHFPTIQSLRGIAGSLPRSLSWHEIEEIAHEDRAEQVMGSM
jgi:AbrB family looped-hinge helix DNA binding protein